MRSFFLINNKKIHYSVQGSGKTIVLLHGYLESLEIWNQFAIELAYKYRVVCIDIPGHGKSECLTENHTMEDLAQTVHTLINHLNVDKCFMIGHSMGGYVTLMYHKLFPENLYGFSLFHSHPFADTEETRKKRLREIDLVNDGKKELIAKFNIPNAFNKSNLSALNDSIQNAIAIALKTPVNGIIANLKAMLNRPDLSESLFKSTIPFLFILGEQDNYIDLNSIIPKIILPQKAKLHVLEHSGHMGFIEEKEISLKVINQFINTI